MAGIKISALPAVTSALLTDFFPVVQAGVTSQETIAQVATLFGFNGSTILGMAYGGSGAAITPNAGGIIYSTGTTMAILNGTNVGGQILLSGTSAPPVWSTATYPATAGSSGNVLISNGTNFSSGTATGITALGTQAQALNMGTHAINNVVDPVNAQDAATKNYVDSVASGGGAPVTCATTANLSATQAGAGVGATLTNNGSQAAFSVDGITPSVNARVLVKDQSTNTQNGVYILTNAGSVITNWVLTRATDYDTPADINGTSAIPVSAGTVNANTSWTNTTLMVTVDTTAITFVQFGFAVPVTVPQGGTGLTTTTAYGLITGGTTATGAFQNAGAGTSGQVYVSAGASSLGTWTASTGSGSVVFATSPTLVTPVLGTPTTGTLTTCTGYTGVNIVTSITGTSPAAGKLGEIITSNVAFGSGVSLSSGNAQTITSISCTAGNWAVSGLPGFTLGNSSVDLLGGISLTNNTLPDISYCYSNYNYQATGAASGACMTQYFSFSTTTTVYLVGKQTSGGTSTGWGTITAQRTS